MSSKIKYMFLTAICVALASQFQINFFVQGFIITLSVIIFPLFLYFYAELNPLFTAMLTALVSPLFRGIVLYSENRNWIITETLVWRRAADAGYGPRVNEQSGCYTSG